MSTHDLVQVLSGFGAKQATNGEIVGTPTTPEGQTRVPPSQDKFLLTIIK